MQENLNNTSKTLQKKRKEIMIGESPNRITPELFRPTLTDFIDRGNGLALLADNVDWQYFEHEFAPLYSKNGHPVRPIRLMVGVCY